MLKKNKTEGLKMIDITEQRNILGIKSITIDGIKYDPADPDTDIFMSGFSMEVIIRVKNLITRKFPQHVDVELSDDLKAIEIIKAFA